MAMRLDPFLPLVPFALLNKKHARFVQKTAPVRLAMNRTQNTHASEH